jgi:hypothetical protein
MTEEKTPETSIQDMKKHFHQVFAAVKNGVLKFP